MIGPKQAPVTIRPAQPDELGLLKDALIQGPNVHLLLDWWTLDDWLGSPALLVADDGRHICGLSLVVNDHQPVAWWRALALSDGYSAGLLQSLFEATQASARQLGASTLACLPFVNWLEHALPRLRFKRTTQIVTLRKDDRQVPVTGGSAVIRPASLADLQAVLAVDHAAFTPMWRYGAREMAAMWPHMRHVLVAEQGNQVVGYASGDLHQSVGHIVRLAVHPAYQRRQVGARLLAEMVQAFYAAGAQAVTLNTQTDNLVSQKLYGRFNFHRIGFPITVWEHPLAAL